MRRTKKPVRRIAKNNMRRLFNVGPVEEVAFRFNQKDVIQSTRQINVPYIVYYRRFISPY